MGAGVPGFVIAAEEVDVGWVQKFEAEEQHDGLEGVVAAVDEIADEDVAGGGGRAGWMGGEVPICSSFCTS